MYPKVKVRNYELVQHKGNYLLSLKDLPSLFIHDDDDLVKKTYIDSPPSIARIQMPNVVVTAAAVSLSEGVENIEDDKMNIRASSIPPPRAVLSSPDNDEMIGNKNKTNERPPTTKMRKSIPNRHRSCQVIRSHAITETLVNTRGKSNIANDRSDHNKEKKEPPITVSNSRVSLRTGKPSSLRI